MTDIKIWDFVRSSILRFGIDVNTNRQLPLIYDGLKPVYRRIIYNELTHGDKMRKVASIAGELIGTTHPHGEASVLIPVSNLVRWGINEGEGNHGFKSLIGEDIIQAAPRYIEAKLSDNYYRIFKELIKFVPMKEAEMIGYEPEYIPTPIPLCLTFGLLGIGIGVNSRIPAFSPKSLIQALKYQDPNYLEAPFGLILMKDKSELQSLWDTGIGKITYSFEVEQGSSGGSYGAYIKGSAELFKPNLSLFKPYLNDGRIFMNDETDMTGSKIFIGRNFRVRSISLDEIVNLAKQASIKSRVYRLTVTDGSHAYRIPLKDWLNLTYDNYKNLTQKYLNNQIESLRFNYEVTNNLSKVSELIFNDRDITPEMICEKLNLSNEIVKTILQKNLNSLRNTESGKNRLDEITSNINYYEKVTVTDIINKIFNEF